MAVEPERQRQRVLGVAAAAPGAAHRHGGLAAREQHQRARRHGEDRPRGLGGPSCHRRAEARDASLAAAGAVQGERRVQPAEVARLAFQVVAQDHRLDAGAARRSRGRLESGRGRREDDDLVLDEACVVWLRGLGHVAAQTRAQQVVDRRRPVDAIALEDGERLGERRRVWDSRPGRDHRGVVPGHVADQVRHHVCGVSCGREPAALDGREVLPHAVDLGDGRARAKEALVHRTLVVERDAGSG